MLSGSFEGVLEIQQQSAILPKRVGFYAEAAYHLGGVCGLMKVSSKISSDLNETRVLIH